MSDNFFDEDQVDPIICDIIDLPDKGPEISCMKIAQFTMEDGTLCCEEHRDMLIQTDGLEWTPGVQERESNGQI